MRSHSEISRTSDRPTSAPQSARQTAQFADQRTASALQAKLQAQAADMPQSQSLQALQAKADALVQRAAAEEDEPLQGKFATVQRVEAEDEEPLQGKFAAVQRVEAEDEEPLQGKFATVQRVEAEDEEPLQGKFAPIQRQEAQANRTGLPDQLKAGVESLSGMSLDGVRVHYNSAQPAQLNALAYAQGTDIHVAPGQEQHLPHEAWHVVQQAQGRVKPTVQMKEGVPVNDDPSLEHEADAMGQAALQMKSAPRAQTKALTATSGGPAQLATKVECTTAAYSYNNGASSDVVGRSMIAHLDPGTPVNGSAPGDGEQSGLMGYLKDTKDFRSMIRGHLMNGQLGGPGIAANLHPLTSQANSWHKFHVENYVKKALDNDIGVIYRVDVNSEYNADGATNAGAEFRCQSWVWDPKKNVLDLTEPEPFTQAIIRSAPAAGSSGAAGISENVNPKLTFLTKDLPDGWGEKGKGLSHWNGKVPAHFSSK